LIKLIVCITGRLDLVSAYLRLAATVLEHTEQIIKLSIAVLFKINLSKSQADGVPQFFILSLERIQSH